ncbi:MULTISPECIES: hypothetical protein [Microbacterium]|uniref:hypothetical protein n=1 Tax=Microbacterium TaxID=33882 RepID=UPI00277EEAF9|nr:MULTISPECIES: hypothetical protein [Microbacterium]MDQ1082833.1 putative oxidoreductase [Microbacterium sp. SORGH_AS_0344]MDQ1168398.1 putative oxidoreductase [Microbacterium proteolyticum]
MVEPVSVTLGAIAAALVAKVCERGIDKTASGVVDETSKVGAKVVSWLRQRLSSTDELDGVERYPDSQRALDELADVIDAEIVDEADVAHLQALVAEWRDQVPAAHQTAIGNRNIQAVQSTVHVNLRDR